MRQINEARLIGALQRIALLTERDHSANGTQCQVLSMQALNEAGYLRTYGESVFSRPDFGDTPFKLAFEDTRA